MQLPQAVDCLIVGAGPTGLACALSLVHEGCSSVLVVDSSHRNENASRAVALHAGTLEHLDKLGCANPLVDAGIVSHSFNTWASGHYVSLASFDLLAAYTKFPMVVSVPQYVIEQIFVTTLAERGVNIARPHRVVGMCLSRQDKHYTDVHFEDGQIVRARYVIGADGARSTVRQIAGIEYEYSDGQLKNPSEPRLIDADVTFTHPLPLKHENDNVIIMSPDNTFIIIPLPRRPELPEERIYRIGIGVPPSYDIPPKAPTMAYLQHFVDAWGPRPMGGSPSIAISRTLWSTRFRDRSAIARTLFTRLRDPATHDCGRDTTYGGVIVIAGDAAHINPPAGGQGLNLGICDGLSLGHALARHLELCVTQPDGHPASLERPLQEWATKRRRRALSVIRLVKLFSLLGPAPLQPLQVWGFLSVNMFRVRNVILRVIMKSSWVRMMIAWQLSGLGAKF